MKYSFSTVSKVADIKLENGTTAICHTPALGCCGLVDKDRTIYVTRGRQGSKTE